jgi:hypothetical protein
MKGIEPTVIGVASFAGLPHLNHSSLYVHHEASVMTSSLFFASPCGKDESPCVDPQREPVSGLRAVARMPRAVPHSVSMVHLVRK